MSQRYCESCDKREAVGTDAFGRRMCGRCAAGLPEPVIDRDTPAPRNCNCPCGSGKKFKRCCRLKGAVQ